MPRKSLYGVDRTDIIEENTQQLRTNSSSSQRSWTASPPPSYTITPQHAFRPASPTRIATRLAVCVDGTWGEPDGIHNEYNGNISNVFRMFLATEEAQVPDASGRMWNQSRRYFKGLNNLDSSIGRMKSGAFGDGLHDQIKEVYKYCCKHAPEPDDEIYFFGFSRGAYCVSAVANMMHYLNIPKASVDSPDFDRHYYEGLKLYEDIRRSRGKRITPGADYNFLYATKAAPTVKFIGAFDTVKAFKDKGLYDISPVSSVNHYRHALAMNEQRASFKPEIWQFDEEGGVEYRTTTTHSLLQAWFFGTHSDLGGANQKDGLALYPLQWMLSEAKGTGLSLKFNFPVYTTKILKNNFTVTDPLRLVFRGGLAKKDTRCEVLTLQNNIRVRMWDLERTHKKSAYTPSINKPNDRWSFSMCPRKIFSVGSHRLLGYNRKAACGSFIHPSAYLIYEKHLLTNFDSNAWSLEDGFIAFRKKALPYQNEIFWDRSKAYIDDNLKATRILVCGNAGIGKSTLLNKITGMDDFAKTNADQYVRHNIWVGKETANGKMIIHDSRGFAAGKSEEIRQLQDFIRDRSTKFQITEKLHCIWFCVAFDRTRADVTGRKREGQEGADSAFFNALKACDSHVPVVVVFTRYDKESDFYQTQAQNHIMEAKGYKRERQLSDEDWDEVDALKASWLADREALLLAGVKRAAGGFKFSGPVFTREDKPETYTSLIHKTANALDDDRIRQLFIEANMT